MRIKDFEYGSKVLTLYYWSQEGCFVSNLKTDAKHPRLPDETTTIYQSVFEYLQDCANQIGQEQVYSFRTTDPKLKGWAIDKYGQWDERGTTMSHGCEWLILTKRFRPSL